MSTSNRGGRNAVVLTAMLLFAAGTIHAQPGSMFAGIGRAATAAEIDAWNIDVRSDFAGLPLGSGSVARGQEIWDAHCASCHGSFGESNEVFTPMIGGTTADDVKTGHVKSLTTSELQRTTIMKLSSLASLWDYTRRAMPWTAPKSLSVDDVYAVSAYTLHLADLVPAGFVLSDSNIRATEKLLPNRNGMTRDHGLWKVNGKADVKNSACMNHCETDIRIRSFIPDYARNAHGNLALQNRVIGGVRGADTTVQAASSGERQIPAQAIPVTTAAVPGPAVLATQQGCLACHGVAKKIVGPGFREIAARYQMDTADAAAIERLAGKIRMGGSGSWGNAPMPPQAQLSQTSAEELARWIAKGAPSP